MGFYVPFNVSVRILVRGFLFNVTYKVWVTSVRYLSIFSSKISLFRQRINDASSKIGDRFLAR